MGLFQRHLFSVPPTDARVRGKGDHGSVKTIRADSNAPCLDLGFWEGRAAFLKSGFNRKEYAPSVRRHSTHRVRAVSKRHSRQEIAGPQRLSCGPCRQAFTNLIIKIHQTIMVTHVRIVSGFLCNYRPKGKWLVISLLTTFSGIPPAPVGCPGRSGRG